MSKVIYASDSSFESDTLNAEVPVLVDFWAEWCGPCRMLSPVLEEISDEYDGKLKVVKVNVDENSVTAAMYGVRGIPTLLLFKDGQVIGTIIKQIMKKWQVSNWNYLPKNGIQSIL